MNLGKKEKSNFIIYPLPVLTDNIVWIWVFKDKAIAIDPSISQPVQTWIKSRNLNLQAILQTHHHEDHIGGTRGLIETWPTAEVIASKADIERIPFQTISVKDGDQLNINGFTMRILEIPGHTSTHIAFHLSDSNKKESVLFCGDTLFSGGCGRLFEGSPEDMFNSLSRINLLPSKTKLYCGHEYTENNLRWAKALLPDDLEITLKLEEVIKKRKEGITSLPSSLQEERNINLFLRAKDIKEFSHLRNHKDNWVG